MKSPKESKNNFVSVGYVIQFITSIPLVTLAVFAAIVILDKFVSTSTMQNKFWLVIYEKYV